MRNNTERPETVEIGTNVLVGSSPEKLKDIFTTIKNEDFKVGKKPKNGMEKLQRELLRFWIK